MKKKTVVYYPYVGTKLNDEVFKNENSWEYHLKKRLKKHHIDIHTYDKVDLKDADYVLVFDNIFYQNLDIMWKIYNQKKLEKSVYINYEPISGHARNHDEIGMKNLSNIFNKIITYDDDIVDDVKFIKGNIANFFSEEKSYNHNFKKRKFMTMISNNTSIKSIIQLLNYYNCTKYYNKSNTKDNIHSIYKERAKVANYFNKHHTNEFDLYGDQWNKKYKKIHKGTVKREDKIKVLSQYNFAISYDSYIHQNGYISEKIFDCFMAKTVPIYLGADNIDEYIPKDCYIDKKQFKTYDELYNYLKNIDEKTYEKYINNIENYLKSKQFKEHFSSEYSAKVIEKSLLNKGKINYQKAYNSLMFFENKRRKIHKHKIVYYTLYHINHESKKMSIIFKMRKGSNIRIESNGLKEPIEIKLDHDNTTKIQFEYNVPNFYIKIFNINADEYFNFISSNKNKDRELGLIPKGKKKLVYYNYTELSRMNKLKYIVFHNKRKVWRKIRRKNEI